MIKPFYPLRVTFQMYIKHMAKVNPLLTRYFVFYLKKNGLLDKFIYNMDVAYYDEIILPTYPEQLMGWAFKKTKTPEGRVFWERWVSRWVQQLEIMEKQLPKNEAN